MNKKNNSNRSIVIRHLEQAILTGRYKPGERLLEIALAREIGVSQGSIREALAELEMRGLVVKYPNRGTYVIELDTQGVRDCFQVRGELEPLACILLANALTRETEVTLRQRLDEMRRAAADGDYPVFQNAILQFHRTIWGAQPNRFIEKFLNITCLPLFAYDLIRRFSHPYTNYARLIRQHELLLTALLMSDGETAARLMKRYLRQWLREDMHDYAESPLPVVESGKLALVTTDPAEEDRPPKRRPVRSPRRKLQANAS